MANTPTTYYAINKPASGDTGWGTTMNANMDTIDTALQGMAQLAGRAGGQTLYGGTAANDDITIQGTSHATKTTSYVLLQDAGGRVGIGTTSPVAQLSVHGTGQAVSALTDAGNRGGTIYLHDTSGGAGNGGAILFGALTGTGVTPQAAIKSLLTNGTAGGIGDLAFATRNATGDSALTERMRILANGRVGIGTSAPDSLLHTSISTANTSTVQQLVTLSANSTGTVAAGFGSRILWELESSTTADQDAAAVVVGWSDATHATRTSYMTFSTVNSAGSLTERMRITGVGNVGIGSSAASYALEVVRVAANSVVYVGTTTSGLAQIMAAGAYSDTNPGFFEARAGASFVLMNYDTTANNYSCISFKDANSYPVAQIAAVNTDHVNHGGYLAFLARPASGTALEVMRATPTEVVVNDTGAATVDFRVESDTEANMLFVNANANTDGSVYLGGTTNGIEIKKGGDLTLLGTAKYERHVQIDAKLNGAVANQPTAVDFFTAGGLQFATTGAKYAYCQWEVPDDWDGTDVVFEIDWFPDSGAISGTDAVRWTVEYRSIAEGELINNGTSVTLDNGVGGDTADYSQYQTKHSRFTLTYNNANQPLTAQDHIYFKISRDTAVTNDFGGTVTVSAYEVIYQSKGFPTSN